MTDVFEDITESALSADALQIEEAIGKTIALAAVEEAGRLGTRGKSLLGLLLALAAIGFLIGARSIRNGGAEAIEQPEEATPGTDVPEPAPL